MFAIINRLWGRTGCFKGSPVTSDGGAFKSNFDVDFQFKTLHAVGRSFWDKILSSTDFNSFGALTVKKVLNYIKNL